MVLRPYKRSETLRLPWFRLGVSGPSMIPTLAPGDWLVVRRTSRTAPGKVVVARLAGRLVVKRAVRLDPGGWWIEGDNTNASDDSRTYGPATEIVGEVRWRYAPLRAAGRVR